MMSTLILYTSSPLLSPSEAALSQTLCYLRSPAKDDEDDVSRVIVLSSVGLSFDSQGEEGEERGGGLVVESVLTGDKKGWLMDWRDTDSRQEQGEEKEKERRKVVVVCLVGEGEEGLMQ